MAEHVCPWWVGYLLLSPFRRWAQNPDRILSPYVDEGMTVLDLGCGMGFFTLPLARYVGMGGRVVAVDLQEKMIAALRRRASRAGLEDRIDARTCTAESLGIDDLAGTVGFAAAINVVHEVPDQDNFFRQVHSTLTPNGKLLVVEPIFHVTEDKFRVSESAATDGGFTVIGSPKVRRSRAVLLVKKA